jgi:uncharacterized protein
MRGPPAQDQTLRRRRRRGRFASAQLAETGRQGAAAVRIEVRSVKLHRDQISSAYRVTAYGPGYISINDERITTSLVVTPGRIIRDWAPNDFSEIDHASFAVLDELEAEVVLLGTGASQQFPQAQLQSALMARGIGIEIMDTAAACRTYNILMAEGRTVVAMLLPI